MVRRSVAPDPPETRFFGADSGRVRCPTRVQPPRSPQCDGGRQGRQASWVITVPLHDCQMGTTRVRLRDTAGAVVATIDVTADADRVEHEGRWFRRGGGGSAMGPDSVLVSFHEELTDE